MQNGDNKYLARLGVLFLFALYFIPLATIVVISFDFNKDIFLHVSSNLLDDYIRDSFRLLFTSLVFALPLGVISGWLVATYRFTGRNFFRWGLLLPLALPSYICGYSLVGWFESTDSNISWIRAYPLLSAGMIFALGLYPYLYIFCKNSFELSTRSFYETASIHGKSSSAIFFKVYLWIAMPAIVAGASLISMEVLADFGLVSYFGVSTFTSGIFRVWNNLNDIGTATMLGIILVICEIFFISLEKYNRKKMKYYNISSSTNVPMKIQLRGTKNVVALLFCLLPITLGFFLPISQLISWTSESTKSLNSLELPTLVANSLLLGAGSALVIVSLSFAIVSSIRLLKNKLLASTSYIFSMGYAFPGIVIAISISAISSQLDNSISSITLIFSGSIAMLIYCFMVRFTSISFNSLDSSMQQVKPSMEEQMKLQGMRNRDIWFSLYLPILKKPLLFTFMIVFIEIIKELPATLILRPHFFNTLSVRAYELISDEQVVAAAPISLCLVAVGLVFVYLISRLDKEGNYVS